MGVITWLPGLKFDLGQKERSTDFVLAFLSVFVGSILTTIGQQFLFDEKEL